MHHQVALHVESAQRGNDALADLAERATGIGDERLQTVKGGNVARPIVADRKSIS